MWMRLRLEPERPKSVPLAPNVRREARNWPVAVCRLISVSRTPRVLTWMDSIPRHRTGSISDVEKSSYVPSVCASAMAGASASTTMASVIAMPVMSLPPRPLLQGRERLGIQPHGVDTGVHEGGHRARRAIGHARRHRDVVEPPLRRCGVGNGIPERDRLAAPSDLAHREREAVRAAVPDHAHEVRVAHGPRPREAGARGHDARVGEAARVRAALHEGFHAEAA